jgi:hypothetical protein
MKFARGWSGICEIFAELRCSGRPKRRRSAPPGTTTRMTNRSAMSGNRTLYSFWRLRAEEFRFDDETGGMEEPEDPEQEVGTETTYPGEGWTGCAVGICLATPYAVINLSSYSRYEDGTISTPDVESFIYTDKANERVDTDQYHRELLTPHAFQKLEELRGAIASILADHRIQVLDEHVLNWHVPDLKARPDVFLEEPLRVRDAFFFRGV